MALSSAQIVGATPSIDRPFGWKTYYVTPLLLTGDVDCTVDTLPAGTIILDTKLVIETASTSVSTTLVKIEVGATGAGDTALSTLGADSGKVLGNTESAPIVASVDTNLTTVNAVSLGGADLVVNLNVTYGGTETTAPTVAVFILCGRNEY